MSAVILCIRCGRSCSCPNLAGLPWLGPVQLAGPSGGMPAEAHKGAAEVVRGAFRQLHGRDPSPRELLFSLAIGRLESGYGRASYKGPNDEPVTGHNNWGAVQAGGNWTGETFEAKDSSPDPSAPGGQRVYVTRFRRYPTPEAGAADLIKQITTQRPVVWAAMRSDGATVYQFSDAMRRSKYYEGFCPKASAAGKKGRLGVPTTEAEFACHAEAVKGHANLVGKGVNDAAAALGLEAPAMGDESQIAPVGVTLTEESFAAPRGASGLWAALKSWLEKLGVLK